MADIARLGFAADTNDLKNAKASLDALVPSAKKAEKAADDVGRAVSTAGSKFQAAAAGAKATQGSFAAAATGATALNRSALMAGTAMGTVKAAAAGANASINVLDTSVKRIGLNFAQADAHIEAYRASLAKVPGAAQNAKTSLDRLGAAANDNINRLQSTPGNIAAQFQDIGVTAAGGMSPLLIALQQGTQLSSAMQGGIANLLGGFRQLFSVTTILTVGLVGLVAAGLQNVDWMGLAQSLLYGLADAIEQFSDVAAYAGVVLAIAFGPQTIVWVTNLAQTIGTALVAAIGKATAAMIAFSLANPFSALVLAIGVVIGAMIALNDTFGGAFTNILNMVRSVANAFISAFGNAFNHVLAIIQATVNAASNAINSVFGAVGIDMKVGRIDLSGAMIDTSAGRDFVGEIGGWISNNLSAGADWLRGVAGGIGAGGDGKTDKAAKGRISEAERLARAYEDIVSSVEAEIRALQVESRALEMSEHAARRYRNEQDLLAKVLDKGIPITDAVAQTITDLARRLTDAQIDVEFKKITKSADEQLRALRDQADLIGLSGQELEYNRVRQELLNDAISSSVIDLNNMTDAMRAQVGVLSERAAAIARQSTANTSAEFMADLAAEHEREIAMLERERGEIGLTGVALQAYRLETDLLADAKRQNINLGPQELAQIRQYAAEYAIASDTIRKQREQVEFFRGTYRGFFGDMINGLREGQSVWQSFGNAVMSVVNRIIDRLLDMEGGVLDKLVGLGSSLLGIGGGAWSAGNGSPTGGWGTPGLYAKGAAFGRGGIEQFARGGAFTNGIYSSPTLFKFANGAALGQMAEAGPEAVMPLKRGPNGSLGVEVHDSQPIRVEIGVNDDRFNAYVDDRAGGVVAQSAPTIASAGSEITQRTAAFRNSRRLA